MSRATQWAPLCEPDPTPGTPDEVERAGRHYTSMAEEIDAQVRRLGDIVDGTLSGGYVQTLTKAADGLKDELGTTSGRYREVGGVLQQWAPQLREFQNEAEWLRQQAVAAAGDMSANRVIEQLSAVGAPPPDDAEVAASKAKQGRYDDARGDLSRAQGRLVDLTDRRDAAAARIAEVIRQTCDDAVANSGWDDFQDWMDGHADLLKTFCSVLGVIAMAACVIALFVPGLNLVAAGILIGIAVGATSASLIIHSALAATDNGSWVDVGMDAFALATFGTGRFLGPGIKILGKTFGGTLGRLTAETKAAGAIARGNTARGPIRAKINTEVAQSRQRLVGGVSRRVGRSVTREVKAIRAQGQVEGQQVFNAARDAYATQKTLTAPMERLALGGGDADIAGMRKVVQDAALGFSPTSKVGLAAAKANAQGVKAAGAMGASTVTTGWSVWTDLVPIKPYDDWRDRWPTKVKGDL